MNSRKLKRWLGYVSTMWAHLAGIIVIVMMWGMMSTETEGRPLIVSADYFNLTLSEVASAYKQAYAAAGFEFKKQTILKNEGQDGKNVTELVFEYTNPDFPHKGKAIVSFNFASTNSADHICMPCKVYPQVFGGAALSQYDSGDYGKFIEKLISADLKANNLIRHKLGISVRPAPPLLKCSPEINC